MTKITNELLEDYAMLYPRIECVKIGKLRNGNRKDGLFIPFDYFLAKRDYPYEIEYIQLRSIDSIADEECREILNLLGHRSILIDEWARKFIINKSSMYREVADYLRSIGIATPFRGITVDELAESGKLKLIK